MYSALAPLVGAVITLMNGINSRFAGFVGYIVASLVIHVVGLVLVSLILLGRREVREPGRLPFLLLFGRLRRRRDRIREQLRLHRPWSIPRRGPRPPRPDPLLPHGRRDRPPRTPEVPPLRASPPGHRPGLRRRRPHGGLPALLVLRLLRRPRGGEPAPASPSSSTPS